MVSHGELLKMIKKIHRENNTFVITKNRLPYHVIPGDPEYSKLLAEYNENPQNFTEEYKYTPSLQEFKNNAYEKINILRQEKEKAGFSYRGKIFDSDSVSMQRLLCAAQAAATNPDFTIEWTLKDNSNLQLDALQMQEVVATFCAYNNELHEQATTLKEAISKAQSIDEVEQIMQNNT